MIDSLFWMAALIFSGALVFCIGCFYYFEDYLERQQVMEKIENRTRGAGSADPYAGESRFWGKKELIKIISRLGHILKPRDNEQGSRRQSSLVIAGYRSKNAELFFWGAKGFCAIVLPVSFSFLRFLFLRALLPGQLVLVSVLLAFTGFYLPELWIRVKIAQRQEKIKRAFPDALDLLVVCVEAGMGMDAAITRVAEEMRLSHPVISNEFQLLNLELRAGKERSQALRNLASRTGLDDINSLVTLLIQTDKFGTSVARALRVHSDSMRTKRYQRADEKAGKVPVKLVFPLVFFILPCLFLVIMGPPVMMALRMLKHH